MVNNIRIYIAVLLVSCAMLAQAATVQEVRVWKSPDSTRVVFDLSAAVNYRIFTLHNPERLVIDLVNSTMKANLDKIDWRKTAVSSLRYGSKDKNNLRVVLDLVSNFRAKSFTLRPNKQYGNRLVIDLLDHGQETVVQLVAQDPASSKGVRDYLVALDAGHGGEDPGAVGRNGALEKDIVLQIARYLEAMINAEPKMRALMIRNGDYYIGLRQRVQKARIKGADLFISIHADAFADRRARGSSVFTLSRHGASSEAARWLAARENQADLIGGVSLDDKDDLLASVLLDLSQTASNEASFTVGKAVLANIRKLSTLHSNTVQHAGFVVLKAPDIPSILVETGFISNPSEARKLRRKSYQKKMAAAIMRGVRSYFAKQPPSHRQPPVLRVTSKNYKVVKGDTLSAIAHRFKVSVASLRHRNQLVSDNLKIGQIILIPQTNGG